MRPRVGRPRAPLHNPHPPAQQAGSSRPPARLAASRPVLAAPATRGAEGERQGWPARPAPCPARRRPTCDSSLTVMEVGSMQNFSSLYWPGLMSLGLVEPLARVGQVLATPVPFTSL